MEIRFHGRGGQGALTAARILASAFWKEKKYSLVLPEFKSERRSAPIAVFLRISENPIKLRSKIYTPDYLIILDPSLIQLKQAGVLAGFKKEQGLIIVNAAKDSSKDSKYLELLHGHKVGITDVNSISRKYGLGPRALPATGTAILGVFAKVTKLLSLESILEAVQESDELPKKDENAKAVQEALESAELVELEPREASAEEQQQPGELDFQNWRELPQSVVSLGDTTNNLTGVWRKVKPYYENKISPCSVSCPLGNNIPVWVSLINQGEYRRAWEALAEKNPLPATIGRVCQAFCEKKCNRAEFDQALSINALEKFLGDLALANGWRLPVLENQFKDFRVAVVGSGPAGLSCAYQLARRGYRVTIFEQLPVAGGMLRIGIPEFRLPKSFLASEIANILFLGIELKTNVKVDQILFDNLRKEFDAIFIATGLQKNRRLNIPGEVHQEVLYGLEFLKKINLLEEVKLGKKVIVIGGGNTAIDAARTAKWLGSEVEIFYRRTKTEMPAIETEIKKAQEDGIKIRELVIPYRILRSFGKNLAEFQVAERGKPVPIRGSNFQEEFDTLIIAVGEEAGEVFYQEGEKIFSGGDIKTKAGTVAAAIGSGKEAAIEIERRLAGKPPEKKEDALVVQFSDLNPAYFKRQKKVEDIFSFISAQKEAQRCFGCGNCDLCGNCWKFCPHMAVFEKEGELKINYDYCKGCGICWQECPRSVISKELEE